MGNCLCPRIFSIHVDDDEEGFQEFAKNIIKLKKEKEEKDVVQARKKRKIHEIIPSLRGDIPQEYLYQTNQRHDIPMYVGPLVDDWPGQ